MQADPNFSFLNEDNGGEGGGFPFTVDSSGNYIWNNSSLGNQTMNAFGSSTPGGVSSGASFPAFNDPTSGASDQTGVDNNLAGNFNKSAYDVNSQLFPFLSGEISNPQGFGDDAVNKMKTEGGEAVAGGLGQATEAAQLLGSRTGNTAAAPGIIDAASRNAMKQTSDNALGIDINNAKAKMAQQQNGAAGLGSQYSTDVNAALGSLGLVNQANQIGNQNDQNGFFGSFLHSLGSTLGSPNITPGGNNPVITF